MPSAAWSTDDQRAFERRGIRPAEAERQLALLRNPPPPIVIDRPCTVGDGIERIDTARAAELNAMAVRAAAAGRVSEFIPASGAASRMFKELEACRAESGPLPRTQVAAAAAAGDPSFAALEQFLAGLDRFAFRAELEATLARGGDSLAALADDGPCRPLLDALLAPGRMACAQRPKGLLAFHAYPGDIRTAFDEHLIEAAELARDAGGRVRAHFTVSAEHEAGFAARRDARLATLEPRSHEGFDVTFSTQDGATDTLAIDERGAPVRAPDGTPLLRPAGHGALIGNLSAGGADIALLKNIDNVAVDALKDPTFLWGRVLIGRLLELEAESRFDRPLRVCGMVPNTGEPGGGPFWVRGADGALSRQIVESAQVNTGDPAQRAAFARGTHFNPVFLACSVRDRGGRPFDLARFVDPEAVILTRKSAGARELLALERPGLWNGAMAHWHTVFVEVPLAVFNPVKTVLDLLRPAHQP